MEIFTALTNITAKMVEQGPVVLCIIGMNGAGKTTMARRLTEIMDAEHIETGRIARAISADSAATGAYAPEEEFQVAFQDEVERALAGGNPIVIEGFPRYLSQLIVGELLLPRPHYILLDTPPLVCIQRLVARGRMDDTPEYIANRMSESRVKMDEVYHFIGDRLHVTKDNADIAILDLLQRIEEARALGDQ